MLRNTPELRLYDTLLTEMSEFREPEKSLKGEFIRWLSHPAMLLRLIPERYGERMPMQLRFTSSQSDAKSIVNLVNSIQNFLLLRHLVFKFLQPQEPDPKADYELLRIDKSIAEIWEVGDTVDPLP